ncbi:hypothetical protein B0T19DRAFT_442614 [Cercophora scortea]|uniref:Uncharacterized protein n=1 Tax=Cercophora scortea TaxID=314031 RepID=A0AAE0M879_9PEZI|nr:hypothetical protein B0T19DRAFT_442614 [Cercophora scortea]
MKTSTIVFGVLATAASVAASTISIASRSEIAEGFKIAADAPDGLYQVTLDEASGNTTTVFTPFDEVLKGATLEARSEPSRIERRRNGCGAGSAPREQIFAAQDCMMQYWPGGIYDGTIYLNSNVWTYCVKSDVVAFICPYSGGYKYKPDIHATYRSIDTDCGVVQMGYNQISGGQGDWTTGRTLRTMNFCTKNYYVGM